MVNPKATATTADGRDVIARTLAECMDLDIAETGYRGHAAALAEEAARAGVELVIAHGGDGTVNEVVNGLLAQHTGTGSDSDDHVVHPERAGRRQVEAPTLGVVPGGSANVFARALGIPRAPMAATTHLLAAIRDNRSRRIGLGKVDARWFTFNAGLGWDADVVADVERHRITNPAASPWLYARTALLNYLRTTSPLGKANQPALQIALPGEQTANGFHLAFVSNTDPWTYLGPRAVRLNPGCTFDSGLGLFALRDLGPTTVLRHIAQALRERGQTRGGNLLRRDNVESVRVVCASPVRLQVDGDYLGRRREVTFTSVPDALRVIA